MLLCSTFSTAGVESSVIRSIIATSSYITTYMLIDSSLLPTSILISTTIFHPVIVLAWWLLLSNSKTTLLRCTISLISSPLLISASAILLLTSLILLRLALRPHLCLNGWLHWWWHHMIRSILRLELCIAHLLEFQQELVVVLILVEYVFFTSCMLFASKRWWMF